MLCYFCVAPGLGFWLKSVPMPESEARDQTWPCACSRMSLRTAVSPAVAGCREAWVWILALSLMALGTGLITQPFFLTCKVGVVILDRVAVMVRPWVECLGNGKDSGGTCCSVSSLDHQHQLSWESEMQTLRPHLGSPEVNLNRHPKGFECTFHLGKLPRVITLALLDRASSHRTVSSAQATGAARWLPGPSLP